MAKQKYNKNRSALIDNMLDLYGYVFCEKCFTVNSYKFHCHHLIFRSEKPNHENLHHTKNLLIVCDKCHSYFHGYKSSRNDIVISRKLNELFNDETLCK